MSRVIRMPSNTAVIKSYFTRITEGLEGVAFEMLAVGKLVAEAERELDPLDLTKLKNELANNGRMSAPTWSKFKAIGAKAVLHTKPIAKQIPGSWTTIYELTALTDGTIKNAVKAKQIHPGMERSRIKELRVGDGASGGREIEAEEYRLGEILVPKNLEVDDIQEFTRSMTELAGEYGARINLAEKQRKQYVLAEVGKDLKQQLDEELTHMRGTKMTRKKLQLYEDTMFQLRKFQETKKYPYRKQDSASIENPRHPFHGYDFKHFNLKLLNEKVITRYSDVTYFTKEEGRLKCLALGYFYCVAENRRQQRNHLKKLEATVSAGQRNAKYAKEVLEAIGER